MTIYFTKSLNIADNNENVATGNEISDPVSAAIEKCRSHPNVMLLRSHNEDVEVLFFGRASIVEVLEQVDSLNTKNVSPIGSIPARIIKVNVDIEYHRPESAP